MGRYDLQFKSSEGRPPISGKVVIGAVIIKHMLDLSDRETILQIQENVFLQYFLGYTSFTNEAPFVASLFVEIRERLSLDILSDISDIVVAHSFEKAAETPVIDVTKNDSGNTPHPPSDTSSSGDGTPIESPPIEDIHENKAVVTNKGKLLMDATVAPQNITYPTDLKLLNAAREQSEALIDKLYNKKINGQEKVRTYREMARKDFLNAARKKAKSGKEIYKANGTQIRYLKRNLAHITTLLLAYKQQGVATPLKQKDIDYLYTLELVYHQQHTMHSTNTHQIENRIVNLHQPHVRPIKRGKEGKKVEFGSKLQVSLVNGFVHLDKLSWDNFNEGTTLQASVELHKSKYGYYPAEVLADQIYCTRENRKWLKEKDIKLMAKPLGRPSKIEGKFGQAKVGYVLANIGAKLKTTSQSWIAAIVLVLNLVRLTRLNLLDLCQCFITLGYSRFGRNFWRLSC